MRQILTFIFSALFSLYGFTQVSVGFRVGTGVSELETDNSINIAGGILVRKSPGQDGKLRIVAIVLDKKPVKLAIVTCDVLTLTRQQLDPVVAEIEKTTGIPSANILINCTHTHHAPSTTQVFGYGPDEVFTKRVQRGIVEAVRKANTSLSGEDCAFNFYLGKEETVGRNSRWLLPDGQINWTGPATEFVRATGPFDPELPVLSFNDLTGKMLALIFNHSTHNIGTLNKGYRSPGFYGLSAQELESVLDCPVCFLEGASGSTHNISLSPSECIKSIKEAVLEANSHKEVRFVKRLAVIKRPFRFKVRQFDEAKEDEAVRSYDRSSEDVIRIFREMRNTLAPQRGQERETWLQVMLIGDVAIVGVPGELFTQLGLDIKNLSPFRYTYVAELANDWIGYLPDLTSHKLGGYQTWTGYQSFAEPGTGERMVDEVVAMLKELARGGPF